MKLTLKNKLTGFAIAGVLAFAMAPAVALGEGTGGVEKLEPDTTLKVSGLDAGDQVSFYKIIEQASPTQGGAWKFVAALDTDADGVMDGTGTSGIKVDDLRAGANPTAYDDFEVITGSMANTIAAQVSGKILTADKSGTATNAGEVTVDLRAGLEADALTPVGLYMAVVTSPAKTDTVYKPIFLSADYDTTGAAKGTIPAHANTNAIALDATVEDTGGTGYKDDPGNGIFKKSKLTLVKEAGDEGDRLMDLKVGDVVPFTITTNLPSYTQNFDGPVFKVTDELTTGLVLSKQSGDAASSADISVSVEGYELSANDYTVTVNSDQKFTVEFKNDNTGIDGAKDGILYTVLGNPKVTITYYAKVTDRSTAAQVNQMDNNVRLDFTNQPKDTTGAGTLKDRTRHYTFGIDANVMGANQGAATPGQGPDGESFTSEIRKIAVDANGEDIYEMRTDANKSTVETENPDKYHWLKGAKFKLEQTHVYKDADADAVGDYGGTGKFDEITPAAEIKFDNNKVAGGTNVPESDENGYITMKGLDAGKYVLTETEAPLGYSFDTSMRYLITITPSFTVDNEADPTFTSKPNKILSGYTVEVELYKGTQRMATATTTYASATAGTPAAPVTFIDEVSADDPSVLNQKGGIAVATNGAITLAETAVIMNKELGILPSTGGSGILFYVAIGVAIMAVGLYLARGSRKRADKPQGDEER